MEAPKVNRPTRGQYRCFHCKANRMAKDGDWVDSKELRGQQVFVCRDCERKVRKLAAVAAK